MKKYVILSKISPHAFEHPSDFKKLAEKVSETIKAECPDVDWKDSYATMGRFDVVDVVESDNPEQVARAAMIIRAFGKSETESLPAIPWKEFLDKL